MNAKYFNDLLVIILHDSQEFVKRMVACFIDQGMI